MSSTFTPKWFKDLGKTCSDLFKADKYNLQQTLEVNTSTSDPKAKLTSKFVSDAGAVSAKFTEKLTVNKYGIDDAEVVLDTAKAPSLELTNNSLVDGLIVKAKCDPNPKGLLTLKWKKAPIAATFEAEAREGDANIEASAVLGLEGLSIGGAVKYEPANEKDPIADYNCAFEFEKNDSVFTVKTENKADVVRAFFSQNLNGNVSLGLGFNYNFASGTKGATVGGTYQIDENAGVKAKIVTDGNLSAVYSHRLSSSAALHLSSTLDVRDIQKNTHKLGIKLVLGDE